MSIEVIGAGFGRTGTASLKKALEALLGGPCYHMIEVFENPRDVDKWSAVATAVDNGDSYDFRTIFEPTDRRPPYRACVDHPVSSYYKQILAQYPDAKVILTVRDSAEVWHASVLETIFNTPPLALRLLFPGVQKFNAMVHRTIWEHVFKGQIQDQPSALQAYEDRIQSVTKVVPAEQLLVFNVTEGWKPLCEFLGKPVPDTPFPRENDREAFHKRYKSIVFGCYCVLAAALAALLTTFLVAYRYVLLPLLA